MGGREGRKERREKAEDRRQVREDKYGKLSLRCLMSELLTLDSCRDGF